MAMYSTRVKHGKKDWLKIKHITLFGCFNPKKSVVVLTVYNPYTIST